MEYFQEPSDFGWWKTGGNRVRARICHSRMTVAGELTEMVLEISRVVPVLLGTPQKFLEDIKLAMASLVHAFRQHRPENRHRWFTQTCTTRLIRLIAALSDFETQNCCQVKLKYVRLPLILKRRQYVHGRRPPILL